MFKGANGNTNSKKPPGRQIVLLLSDLGLRLWLNYASAARMLIRLTGPHKFSSDFYK